MSLEIGFKNHRMNELNIDIQIDRRTNGQTDQIYYPFWL